MTEVLEQLVITEPGVYAMTAADYFADPVPGGSLSSTGARQLVKEAGPAKYRWRMDHPDDDRTEALDFGVAAHHKVLGDLDDRVVLIDADEWRTNAIKDQVEEVRASGRIPIKPKQQAVIDAMADAIERNPTAAALLRSAGGKSEQTLVWRDQASGVWCRARFDYFQTKVEGRRVIIPDYKTCEDASSDAFSADARKYGYHQQDDWYRAGVRALGIDDDPAFVFVAQEKKPPYLVNVVELDDTARSIGQQLNRGAINVYAECKRTGRWPGYGEDVWSPSALPTVQTVSLPRWYTRIYDED